ncbi:MBL fold metallo-hydrolase [Eikenella glucosivorans]|uniref:MBL fold metallo-hydrolase n=1 Tax=Eikenella glucosivorans TaxID=2766967 RepID=UPI001EE53415|nr:MBL fold metallo-hydrolase [Eikenella glucosivorans]
MKRRSAGGYPPYPASDHYDPVRRRFFNPEPQRLLRPLDFAGAFKMFRRQGRFPARPLPFMRPDFSAFSQAGGRLPENERSEFRQNECSEFRQNERGGFLQKGQGVLGAHQADEQAARFVWFGHSTLLLRVAGLNILTDPVFGMSAAPHNGMFRRFQPPPAAPQELPPLDVILYSHSHYDHLEEAFVRRVARSGVRFIVPLGMEVLLRRWGVPAGNILTADWYQRHHVGAVGFTAVPARHDSSRNLADRNRALWAGWAIEGGGQRFYFSGDSSYGSHFAEIGRRFDGFDLAFVENGQYDRRWPDNHMFPEQTVQAAIDVGARRLMPIHWGAFSLALHDWDEPVRRSMPLAQSRGLPVLTPLMGQVFGVDTETRFWWEEI